MVSETDKDITIMKLKTTLRHAEQNRKDALYEVITALLGAQFFYNFFALKSVDTIGNYSK